MTTTAPFTHYYVLETALDGAETVIFTDRDECPECLHAISYHRSGKAVVKGSWLYRDFFETSELPLLAQKDRGGNFRCPFCSNVVTA